MAGFSGYNPYRAPAQLAQRQEDPLRYLRLAGDAMRTGAGAAGSVMGANRMSAPQPTPGVPGNGPAAMAPVPPPPGTGERAAGLLSGQGGMGAIGGLAGAGIGTAILPGAGTLVGAGIGGAVGGLGDIIASLFGGGGQSTPMRPPAPGFGTFRRGY